jgi:hypothetical protein
MDIMHSLAFPRNERGGGGGGGGNPTNVQRDPCCVYGQDEVRVVTVPRTGVVKACHKCRGTGGMTCRDCSGKVSNLNIFQPFPWTK